MTASLQAPAVHRPTTLSEAVRLVAAGSVPLAGGTWIMRRPRTGEHVVLAGLSDLRGITTDGGTVTIGALTTHAELAHAAVPPALRTAAALSAFPQVRNVATVGGNLGASGFAEADLVPALLALDARVRLAGRGDATGLGDYVTARPSGVLLVAVEVDVPPGRTSGFARQTVRGGGEYALASVALAVDREATGVVTAARVAVGAVEAVARRCPGAESALVGAPLTAVSARAAGAAAAAELDPRDAPDAPGWYRAAVLPALFERAAEETR
jgi:carbon-monoxide dehydrogenase medium subunit